ncbi:putative centromere protein Scm3 [Elsinoe australis]|uniref:Putative centromere protein Scm3 n=1 Tax=Elsinoe australis TaxID=40998 RepID=A0A4U7B738_9PEZI|nr:putative centromere protein Scm3 [Elsinoe australis]
MLGTPFRRHTPATETPELQRDRARNDRKLKTRFERIFEKYNKDFSQVGDEIDLRTGRVIIDNGHLSRMQSETDPGASASRRFVRAFTQELGTEDHQESRVLNSASRGNGMSSALRRQVTPPTQVEDSEDELQSSPSRQDTIYGQSEVERQRRSEPAPAPSEAQPSDPTTAMVHSALSGSSATRNIDPNAVQNLGHALANQIASFLNQQMTTQLFPTTNDPWSVPPLPPRQEIRGWHASPTPTALSETWRSVSPSGHMSLWATHDEDDLEMVARRSRKRTKFNHSIVIDHHNAIVPSVEEDEHEGSVQPTISFRHTTYQHFRAKDEGLGKVSDVPQFASSFEEIARHHFEMLAHGFANRGCLRDGETKQLRPPSIEIPATYDDKGRRISPPRHDARGRRIVPRTRADGTTNKRYTKQEDAKLLRLREREGLTWPEIARWFPDRSEQSIQVRYSRNIREGGYRCNEDVRKRLIELASDDEDGMPEAPEQTREKTVRPVSSNRSQKSPSNSAPDAAEHSPALPAPSIHATPKEPGSVPTRRSSRLVDKSPQVGPSDMDDTQAMDLDDLPLPPDVSSREWSPASDEVVMQDDFQQKDTSIQEQNMQQDDQGVQPAAQLRAKSTSRPRSVSYDFADVRSSPPTPLHSSPPAPVELSRRYPQRPRREPVIIIPRMRPQEAASIPPPDVSEIPDSDTTVPAKRKRGRPPTRTQTRTPKSADPGPSFRTAAPPVPEPSFHVTPSEFVPGLVVVKKRKRGRPSNVQLAERKRMQEQVDRTQPSRTLGEFLEFRFDGQLVEQPKKAEQNFVVAHPDEVQRVLDRISGSAKPHDKGKKHTPSRPGFTQEPLNVPATSKGGEAVAQQASEETAGSSRTQRIENPIFVSDRSTSASSEPTDFNMVAAQRLERSGSAEQVDRSSVTSDHPRVSPYPSLPVPPGFPRQEYDFPLDPSLRENSFDHLQDPNEIDTPRTSPEETTTVQRKTSTKPVDPDSTPLRPRLSSGRKQKSGLGETSLRSSVLRKGFETPRGQRASSIASTRSVSSVRTGPVPELDASDDELG